MTANRSARRWLIVLPAQPWGLKASKWCHTEPLIRRELADKSRTILSYSSRVPSCLPLCQHQQGQEIWGRSSSKISEELTPLKLSHLTFEAPRLCVTQLCWERAEGPSWMVLAACLLLQELVVLLILGLESTTGIRITERVAWRRLLQSADAFFSPSGGADINYVA